jgi:hypothetical protein
MNQVLTQEEAKGRFLPQIRAHGKLYKKRLHADVRRAVPGEIIVTITKDGKETQNTAREGDWVIRPRTRQAPMYIHTPRKFADNWDPAVLSTDGPWEEHAPLDSMTARRQSVTYDGPEVRFIADWGEEMILKPGDQIAAYVHQDTEVFRIQADEFEETYVEL